MPEYYHSHCSELSHKRTRSMRRFKITRTKICKGFVLYSTVQLLNSFFKVLGPGTEILKALNSEFTSYSRLCPGSSDFAQHQKPPSSWACIPWVCAPSVSVSPLPLRAHLVSPSLFQFPCFYFLFSFLIKISFLQAFSRNLFLKTSPTYLVLVSSMSQVAAGANRSH